VVQGREVPPEEHAVKGVWRRTNFDEPDPIQSVKRKR